jgi:hypothetical protein
MAALLERMTSPVEDLLAEARQLAGQISVDAWHVYCGVSDGDQDDEDNELAADAGDCSSNADRLLDVLSDLARELRDRL